MECSVTLLTLTLHLSLSLSLCGYPPFLAELPVEGQAEGEQHQRSQKGAAFMLPALLLAAAAAVLLSPAADASVSYDHKALVIEGRRRILISGSIHYPRSTPEVSLLYSLLQMWFLQDWIPLSWSSLQPFCFIFPFFWIVDLVVFRCGRISSRRQKTVAWT